MRCWTPLIYTKTGSTEVDNATALAAFIAGSYGANSQPWGEFLNFQNGATQYRYHGGRWKVTGKTLSAKTVTDVHYVMESKLLSTDGSKSVGVQAGEFRIIIDAGTIATVSGIGTVDIWFPTANIDAYAGAAPFTWEHEPVESLLPDTAIGVYTGHVHETRIILHTATAEENQDEEEKVDYIVFGSPPVASFTASPIRGANPLSVNFNNTSVEAIGTPTTWSWKKRLTGSGDSFVQFSTAKHPTEIFTK